MPPPLALLLCTAFVVWIMRFDRRQRVTVSTSFWLPTIWMFSIATKPLAFWFGAGGVDAESGSPLDRFFQSVLLLCAFVLLQRRRLDWSRALRGNPWILVLLGYMLISIIWSDIPFSSFKRWIRELTAVIMALLVLSERSPREAIITLFRRTTYILVPFSFLLIKYYPAYGRGYTHWSGKEMWMGVTMTKNTLGRLCMMTIIFLLWTLMRRWKGRENPAGKYQTTVEVALLFLSIYLLRGAEGEAYSATSVAAMVAGLATFLAIAWMKRQGILISKAALSALVGGIMLIGITTPLVGGGMVGTYAGAVGRDETLTSRTDIWSAVMPFARAHPIIGSGFGAFWTSQVQAVVNVNEAHSGYLEVILNLGTVGLFLTSMLFFTFTWNARNALAFDFDWANLCVCFIIVNLVYNIGEASMDSLTGHLMAMTFLLALSCQRYSLLKDAVQAPRKRFPDAEEQPTLSVAHQRPLSFV